MNHNLFNLPSVELAKKLLGAKLVVKKGGRTTSGIIVETEAYHQDDAASHSYKGQTPRNSVMFGPGGHAYVYFTYGMHYCFNVVAGPDGRGEAVLIRALEPVEGIDVMRRRRNTDKLQNLCSGPAKLVQALGINKTDNGKSLDGPEITIIAVAPDFMAHTQIVSGPRIGISQAKDRPWRFWVNQSKFVSGPKSGQVGKIVKT